MVKILFVCRGNICRSALFCLRRGHTGMIHRSP